MDIFFSESFQVVVAVLFFCLSLFQVLGLVDVAHGERNLSFYYSQVEGGQGAAILDGTIHGKRKGLARGKYNGTPIHAVDDQAEYVDIYCLRCVVQGTCYASECTSFTVINRIMHTNNELATHVILDPYIISYVLAGFLWGHVALHHDLSKSI